MKTVSKRELNQQTAQVLRFAAAIEPHINSLDAIPLPTCPLLGSAIAVVTHDTGMAEVAGQRGPDTFDPLSPNERG